MIAPRWPETSPDPQQRARLADAILGTLRERLGREGLYLLVPDPALPVDRAALSAIVAPIERGAMLVVATTDGAKAALALALLFEARCDTITVALVEGADPGRDGFALAEGLLQRPLRAPEGHRFAGLVYDWGEPFASLDPSGVHSLVSRPRRVADARHRRGAQ